MAKEPDLNLVQHLREQIANGTYLNKAKMRALVEKLARVLKPDEPTPK